MHNENNGGTSLAIWKCDPNSSDFPLALNCSSRIIHVTGVLAWHWIGSEQDYKRTRRCIFETDPAPRWLWSEIPNDLTKVSDLVHVGLIQIPTAHDQETRIVVYRHFIHYSWIWEGRVLSSASRCFDPLMKHSHSLLIYYITNQRTRKL